jgi:hypothetical protein
MVPNTLTVCTFNRNYDSFMEVSIWTAFATWGQFMMAIVTAIIAGIALFTKIRVEEIAELTAEQAKQTIELIENNEIMRQILNIELKRFGHESKLNILKERPYFIIVRQAPAQNSVQLSLRNKGIEVGRCPGGGNYINLIDLVFTNGLKCHHLHFVSNVLGIIG